ncbi:hypothetical protein [Lysinibacillus sphaericus]|uniref:Uncharacterized protein n=1 Tax=Lysinibacillus sphaericus OT4b.31 TaxID=1285586 RepID=R7ZCQ1_LYSSH|nr:hypothetical protein [Lysinibacillus sphaericus]EON71799.1 hypothetical protein H131_14988 [Lysinibacillus sphaericus OT4b.31]
MIEHLQHAYGQALKNLVFVDFESKKVIGGSDKLGLELSKEKGCCHDLIIAINRHFLEGDFDLVKERMAVLTSRFNYIDRLEKQIKEQRRNKFFEIASQLDMQGNSTKVVKVNAKPN